MRPDRFTEQEFAEKNAMMDLPVNELMARWDEFTAITEKYAALREAEYGTRDTVLIEEENE